MARLWAALLGVALLAAPPFLSPYAVHTLVLVLFAPLGHASALGTWFYRDPEPEPLCTIRVDLAPGARWVTAPRG